MTTTTMYEIVKNLSDRDLAKELDIAPGMEHGPEDDASRLWTRCLRGHVNRRALIRERHNLTSTSTANDHMAAIRKVLDAPSDWSSDEVEEVDDITYVWSVRD